MTDLLTREDTTVLDQTITSDEPEQASHIVPVPLHLAHLFSTPQAYVMQARFEGFEIIALCGYTFIPQQDPEAFPICTECFEIYQSGAEKWGDRDELPSA